MAKKKASGGKKAAPVPDKESVVDFLSLAGKLLSGFGEKK